MDLLTPVIILPVAWLLFRAAAPAPPSSAEVFALVALILAATWAGVNDWRLVEFSEAGLIG